MISEHLLTAGDNLFPTFIFHEDKRESVDGLLQYIKKKKEINDFSVSLFRVSSPASTQDASQTNGRRHRAEGSVLLPHLSFFFSLSASLFIYSSLSLPLACFHGRGSCKWQLRWKNVFGVKNVFNK